MNPQLLHTLKDDESKYPHTLEQLFPDVLARIVALWDSDEAAAYFYELMVENDGGIERKGFSPAVASEIFFLHSTYTHEHQPADTGHNPWAHIPELKRQELEKLGYAYSEESFLSAIERGDEAGIRVFLACGVNVDTRDERDWTPLMTSSFNGNEKLALLLIRSGAKIQVEDKNGYTPLHWAAFNGYATVVQLLLDKGAAINARSEFGWTALMQAATRGHIGVTQVLLAYRAPVNETTRDGWTALHKAAANGHLEIVLVLLEKGADSAIAYPDGSTALSLASKHKHHKVVRVLNLQRRIDSP